MAQNTKQDPTTVQVRPVEFFSAGGKQVAIKHEITKKLDLSNVPVKE